MSVSRENAVRTCSPRWPYTTCRPSGRSARAVSSTCASRGSPANGISTFGSIDFMRLPSPAARTITCNGSAIFSFSPIRSRHDSAKQGAEYSRCRPGLPREARNSEQAALVGLALLAARLLESVAALREIGIACAFRAVEQALDREDLDFRELRAGRGRGIETFFHRLGIHRLARLGQQIGRASCRERV